DFAPCQLKYVWYNEHFRSKISYGLAASRHCRIGEHTDGADNPCCQKGRWTGMTPADNQQNSDPVAPLSAEDQPTPTRRQLRQQQERRSRRNAWIIFGSVLVVVLAIVMFFVYSFSSSNHNGAEQPKESTTRNPSPGLDGIIATNVSPENFLPGD